MFQFLKPKRAWAAARKSNHKQSTSKVLLVADRPNWAYDSIAKALVKYNDNPDLELDIDYIKNANRDLRSIFHNYDLVFLLGWQLLGTLKQGKIKRTNNFLDPKRVLTGIHSHHSWDDRRTTPDLSVRPPEALIEFLQKFAGVNTVSRRLYELFLQSGLTTLACTLNGVDTELFKSSPVQTEGPLRVGFSGNNRHDWRKGISEFIEPGCDQEGIELHLAMPKEGHHINLDQMPGFYKKIDAYVCASVSEGFSLSVLEASASGCPIISTRVGGCEDLIIDGVNGFIVDRDVDAIRDKVSFLRDNRAVAVQMGAMNRTIVEQLWSWDVRARGWLSFIEAHLDSR